jgi:hypothetical protein
MFRYNPHRRKWRSNPTRKNVLVVITLWVVGNGLQFLSLTGLEPERFTEKKPFYFLATLFVSSWIVIQVCMNYLKNQRASRTKTVSSGYTEEAAAKEPTR